MTHTAEIKFARAYDPHVLAGDPLGSGTVYQPNGMTFLPGQTEIPLVVDHNLERQVGVVHGFFPIDWIDQRWLIARCTVTDPPSWLRRGTRASFSHRTLRSYEVNGWKVVSRCLVDEVTIVGPTHRPLEPRAEVLRFAPAIEPTPRSAAAATSDRAAAAGAARPMIRHCAGGRVLRVGGVPVGGWWTTPLAQEEELRRRVTEAGPDADFEGILEQLKRELDAHQGRTPLGLVA